MTFFLSIIHGACLSVLQLLRHLSSYNICVFIGGFLNPKCKQLHLFKIALRSLEWRVQIIKNMNKSKLNTLITGMQRTNGSSNAIIDEKIAQKARHSKGGAGGGGGEDSVLSS